MQVTLLEDIPTLGKKGMAVDVSTGYAENFLFPAHLATESVSHDGEEESMKRGPKPGKKAEAEERALAASLDGEEVVITVKVKDGKLVAPVSPNDVRSALKEAGYKVDEDWIEMSPIKDAGTSEVIINFPSGYEANVTVTVEAIA